MNSSYIMRKICEKVNRNTKAFKLSNLIANRFQPRKAQYAPMVAILMIKDIRSDLPLSINLLVLTALDMASPKAKTATFKVIPYMKIPRKS